MIKKKIIHFIRNQIKQIHKGGLSTLGKKARKLFLTILLVPGILIAMPVVLLMRILSVWVIIRFEKLDTVRIGGLTLSTEVYLCECDAGMHSVDGRKVIDIFYLRPPICNHQLTKMWKRVLITCSFANLVDRANRLIPGGRKHIVPWRVYGDRDINGLLAKTQPHISFTPKEERLGSKGLNQLGIPDNAPFICFHARDAAFLESVYPDGDWNYHNHRDCDIYSYVPAVEELIRRGNFAIRMGAIVKEKLDVANPKIIDYATNSRSDFLDIYLSAKCRFFLCDNAGIFTVPTTFRLPVIRVNFIPYEAAATWGPNDLFIPKKLWLREEGRFLSFAEILNSKIGLFTKDEHYEQLGIELIDHTPEEVTAVAVEMDERLNGSWQTTKEDEELQRRFWSLYKPSELNKVILSRIGAEFLRQNSNLLP